MPKAAEIMLQSAALLNDQAQSVYTNTVLLPYLNMALDDLQEIFQLNNVPVTNQVSAVITIPANTTSVGKGGSPKYPSNLIEIQQMWKSPVGLNQFIPMIYRDFLPHSLENAQISELLYWSWVGDEITFIAANSDNDIKLDYIGSIFVTIIDPNELILVKNVSSFLRNQVAGFAAQFIGENISRAETLYGLAADALSRNLGISVKARQAVITRRRPFRAAYKRRGVY